MKASFPHDHAVTESPISPNERRMRMQSVVQRGGQSTCERTAALINAIVEGLALHVSEARSGALEWVVT